MQNNPHYELVTHALRWIADHQSEQPDLKRLADEMAISPHHLQRTFQSWAGVSPKQFLKSLTRTAARDRLIFGDSVLDAALSTGLSGPGRLHDLMITTEALTPGEIRKRGLGTHLYYGYGESLFGKTLVSWTSRGLHFVGFCQERGSENAFASLTRQWENADFHEDSDGAQTWLDVMFSDSNDKPIPLWLRGSPFQLKIWEALLAVPEGAHITYGQLAARSGNASASRAVGNAVGKNPLAWIIPCHRVIRQMGEPGGYRWGEVTKLAMIGYEASRQSAVTAA
jgi:AraC family transcriptional regulator of adaptative response/methylated-DNA-[protein]-cysteine methyltransferase